MVWIQFNIVFFHVNDITCKYKFINYFVHAFKKKIYIFILYINTKLNGDDIYTCEVILSTRTRLDSTWFDRVYAVALLAS